MTGDGGLRGRRRSASAGALILQGVGRRRGKIVHDIRLSRIKARIRMATRGHRISALVLEPGVCGPVILQLLLREGIVDDPFSSQTLGGEASYPHIPA